MKFSIITPTLQRESLVECCASVDAQTHQDWEHIVCVDGLNIGLPLIDRISHPQRSFFVSQRTYNYGNHQRWKSWADATGDYLLHLDDDNWLAHEYVLEEIAEALEDRPDFAIFPILRHGQRFFNDPPGLCRTDTANVVVKREIGRWPDIPDYTADGIWVKALMAKHRYKSFPEFSPIVVMPKSNEGK